MTKGSGNPNASRAPHSSHDIGVEGVPGSFGLVINLERAPILQLGDGAPASMPRLIEHLLESSAVPRIKVCDGSTQCEQVARREPGDEGCLLLGVF